MAEFLSPRLALGSFLVLPSYRFTLSRYGRRVRARSITRLSARLILFYFIFSFFFITVRFFRVLCRIFCFFVARLFAACPREWYRPIATHLPWGARTWPSRKGDRALLISAESIFVSSAVFSLPRPFLHLSPGPASRPAARDRRATRCRRQRR